MKQTIGKRALAFLLSLLLVVCVCPAQAFAAGGLGKPEITVESVTAQPGDTVKVAVRVKNNPGILSAKLTLSYGNDLTLQGAENGEAFSPLTLTKPGAFTPPCNFVWDGTDIEDSQIKDGVILTLTFSVSPDAETGSVCPVELMADVDDITDRVPNPVEVTFVNGEVTVQDFQYGDLDGNRKVNTTDVILLRRHLAGGYQVSINERAADVDLNSKVNTTDVVYIRRYLAGGYPGVETLPVGGKPCSHTMVETPYKAPTCTEAGNNAYFTCSKCGKLYKDAAGTQQTTLQSVTLPMTGHHIVTVPGTPATETSSGLSDGTKCDLCGTWFQEQQVLPPLEKDSYNISYNLNDYYLKSLTGDKAVQNPNPVSYSSRTGLRLKNIESPGYRFMGWYDMAGSTGVRVTQIAAGETGDVTLYAHWEKETFTVQLESSLFLEESEKTYTVDKGVTLPTPKLSNYVFVGWTGENGEIYPNNKIPAGTVGNLSLTANWTSERNKTYTKTKLDDPIIYEDEENNTLLFAYEIGEIQNVPLYTIKDFGYISGDGVTKTATETYSTTITESAMQSYAKAVSNATTESSDWVLSKDWSESTSIDEKWCKENGYTKEEAETLGKSKTDTWNISNSNSGSKDTTTLDTNQDNWQNQVKVNSSTENSQRDKIAAGISSEIGAEEFGISAKISADLDTETETSTTKKSGVELGGTDGNTQIHTDSTVENNSWNNSSSYGGSSTTSASKTTSVALSEKISQQYGYGQSYTSGGASSASQGLSTTQSSSDEYTSSVTYSKATAKQVTSTWTTQSTKPGYHRWVVAGTAHVFGVVGYDMAEKSYFVFTYSVIDDETHEFEDYSYTSASYSDHQNGVIPFVVPHEVADFVAERTSFSNGLKIDQTTGTILSYSGTDNCVVIPEYMNVGNGDVVKIRAIAPGAFKDNTNIAAVVLSDFITEIPDSAFEGCSSLVGVIGGSVTSIGEKAFTGCTSAVDCVITPKITSLGANAFEGVNRIMVNAVNPEVAQAAVSSGAKKIELTIKSVENGTIAMSGTTLTIPEGTERFFFDGGGQTFDGMQIISNARETEIKRATFVSGSGIPVQIASPEVKLNEISASAQGIAMVFLAEQAHVGLQGTSTAASDNTNALLAKGLSLYEINPNVAGKLVVSPKLLTCTDTEDSQYINYDKYEKISLEDFERLLHSYTLNFDAREGTCTIASKEVPNGTPVGELPIPVRSYYTFDGWYLETGEKVTEDTVFYTGLDQTVTARWVINGTSGWVRASSLPSNAQVVDTKWTYTKRDYTSSASSSYSGWTKYDTKRTSWGGTQGPVYSNPSNGSRNVWSESYVTSSNYKTIYVYHRWTSGAADSGSTYSYDTGYDHVYKFDYALTDLESSNWYGHTLYRYWYKAATGNTHSGNYKLVIYSGTEQQWVSDNYGTRWYYQDPIYTYYYYKDSEKTALLSDPSGWGDSSISNVQKWVTYRMP